MAGRRPRRHGVSCWLAALLVLTCPARSAGFKVIVVGYPRTGLSSLEEALVKLGYAPYRMGHRDDLDKTTGHRKDLDRWLEAIASEDPAPLEKLVDDIVSRGYDSILDLPLDITSISLALARHFPKAKVILTVHDSPEEWFKSYRVHMQDFNLGSARWSPHRQVVMNQRAHALRRVHQADVKRQGLPFIPADADQPRYIAAYEAHNDEIAREVGPERLLTFKAAEGWEPLCAFLGEPPPEGDVPYPKIHTFGQESFHLKQQQHYLFVFDVFFFGIPLFSVSVILHYFWKRWRTSNKVLEEKHNV